MKIQPDWKKLRLWPHQKDAVETVRAYLSSESDGAALVRMPTGTGKTVVMAVLAQCFADSSSVLIVAPWAQLIKQIAAEVGTAFWEKIGQQPTDVLKSVHVIRPVNVAKVLQSTKAGGAVYVSTFQALQRIASKDRAAYNALAKRVTLVMVDEGHREPARTWADAVRGLGKPTALFTATPYRNDLRFFDVDRDYIFRLSHQEAVKSRYIRELVFREEEIAPGAASFVDALRAFYHGPYKKLWPSGVTSPRVIVRCATDDDINEVAQLLKHRGETVVAIHEQFDDGDDDHGDTHRRSVPSPTSTDATFWVHQYKLIEGVDDPSFAVLAIYQPMANARALVQQVGRILRNPERHANQCAYVFAATRARQRQVWERYLEYEQRLGDKVEEATAEDIIADLLNLQEELHYLDGTFRQRFNPEAPDSHCRLRYTFSANVFTAAQSFAMKDAETAFSAGLDDRGYILNAVREPDPDTRVIIYSSCIPSTLLLDETFIEFRLGYAILRRVGSYVFYYDTEGSALDYLVEHGARVQPADLEKLWDGDEVRIGSVSLLNSDLALYAVRRRTLTARAIDQLAPGLADHTHFCSTAAGTVRNAGRATRRYVGFTRARISQTAPRDASYDDYVGWIDATAARLEGGAAPDGALFERYALYSSPPASPKPEHILFDVDDVGDEYGVPGLPEDEGGLPQLLDDRCWDVVDGEFEVSIGGQPAAASLRWDPGRKRFVVESEALQRLFVRSGTQGERRRNLVSHLNAEQAFRIVTSDGAVYSHGHYYRSRRPLWGRKRNGRIDLLQILQPLDALKEISKEKGEATPDGEGWEKGSLFELIDRGGPTGLLGGDGFDPDILICDDMGSELADFIAVSATVPRIALIHAKTAKDSELSASAFHDVCGQAAKNLDVLTPQWNRQPKDLSLWNRAWKEDGKVVKKRIRRGPTGVGATKLWPSVEQVIRHPSASREVWIVMGQGLSYSAFDQERQKDKPKASTIQLLYLLQSTWAAVNAVGARLRVFCSP